MKKPRNIRRISPLIMLFLLIPIPACSESVSPSLSDRPSENIRPPAGEGGFYPGNPSELRGMIRGFIDEVDTEKPEGELIALIVPHAGYVYSGRTAAYSFIGSGSDQTKLWYIKWLSKIWGSILVLGAFFGVEKRA